MCYLSQPNHLKWRFSQEHSESTYLCQGPIIPLFPGTPACSIITAQCSLTGGEKNHKKWRKWYLQVLWPFLITLRFNSAFIYVEIFSYPFILNLFSHSGNNLKRTSQSFFCWFSLNHSLWPWNLFWEINLDLIHMWPKLDANSDSIVRSICYAKNKVKNIYHLSNQIKLRMLFIGGWTVKCNKTSSIMNLLCNGSWHHRWRNRCSETL